MNFLVLAALNPIAFTLGPIQVHWYGIIIASGALLAVILALNEAKKRQVSEDTLLDMILWAIPFSLIGARLYYVIFEWPYYYANPSEIIKIWHGGIAIYGGLIAAALVFIYYAYRHFLPIWLILDIAAPSVMLGQLIGRWGNFMNQEAYGGQTTLHFLQQLHLPNWLIQQMHIQGAYYQPTFLYESLWNLLGFCLLIVLRHKKGLFKQGEVFLSYVMWYSFGRYFIEQIRTDSLYWGNFRVSQIFSVILFIGALIIWYKRRQDKNLPTYLAGNTR